LANSREDAHEFSTTRDDSEETTVMFGDGVNGARPPMGKDNIHARYRRGLGTSGNVPVDGVQQLIDSLAGVQQVTNPQPTGGGADPDRSDQIRAKAPTSMRTFNRAASLQDYAALALTFPGIAKASAAWIAQDANGTLAQPQIQLTVATVSGNPIMQTSAAGQLRNFLDARRDANVPLRIRDFKPVYVDLVVIVDLKDGYPRQATFARVQAALNPGINGDGSAGYFALHNLDFGENLHLSAIYALLMQVSGVRDTNITTFRRMDSDSSDPSIVRDVIFIGPTEIAEIGNDPAIPENGLLTIVQGSGGFVDT
jgi:predicted phage baseplate assembly protein